MLLIAKRLMPSIRQKSTEFNPVKTANQQTFSIQSTLPRLPIPRLEDTIKKYVKSLKPIANEKELRNTRQLTDDFVSSLGPRLQDRLVKYNESQKFSWLEDIWLDRAYLSYRESVMLNVNWYMLFKDHQHIYKNMSRIIKHLPYTHAQLIRAAILTSYAVEYKRLLDSEKIPIDVTKTEALCMHQIARMFGITRIPTIPIDRLAGEHPAPGNNIMLLIDDQIFLVPVIDRSIDYIYSALINAVHQLEKMKLKSPGVCILTSEHRDTWAVQYEKIKGMNGASLDKINDSLFAICLDSQSPKGKNEAAAVALHGWKGRNRWFDKCLQFFVCPDSTAGCNGEHSPCDAVIPNQLTSFILSKYSRYHMITLLERLI